MDFNDHESVIAVRIAEEELSWSGLIMGARGKNDAHVHLSILSSRPSPQPLFVFFNKPPSKSKSFVKSYPRLSSSQDQASNGKLIAKSEEQVIPIARVLDDGVFSQGLWKTLFNAIIDQGLIPRLTEMMEGYVGGQASAIFRTRQRIRLLAKKDVLCWEESFDVEIGKPSLLGSDSSAQGQATLSTRGRPKLPHSLEDFQPANEMSLSKACVRVIWDGMEVKHEVLKEFGIMTIWSASFCLEAQDIEIRRYLVTRSTSSFHLPTMSSDQSSKLLITYVKVKKYHIGREIGYLDEIDKLTWTGIDGYGHTGVRPLSSVPR
ncbi:hypothetical protein C8J56DRAFT_897845 [Mycena floridula]|nr:hypothetical protein C8J56DRAFT_897845 [Mycena floridula]